MFIKLKGSGYNEKATKKTSLKYDSGDAFENLF